MTQSTSTFGASLAARLERRFQTELYRRDPVAWVNDVLSEHVWSKQAEIMHSVAQNPRTAVQSCHGIGKCVGMDAVITLADGTTVEARELVGRTFVIPSWTEDGAQTPAIGYAEHNGDRPLYRLTTVSGRTINRTGNHPLYAAHRTGGSTGRRIKVTPRGWTEVADLTEGDLVLVPEKLHAEGRVRAADEDVKLLGYMLGDGSTTKWVGFTQEEGLAKDEFRELIAHYGCQLREHPSNKYGLIVVGPDGERFKRVASNPVTNRIRDWGLMGCKAIHKRFPDWAWRLPDDQLALMLNRLFACDGWASAPNVVRTAANREVGSTNFQIAISLSSEGMLWDVHRAMLRLGICGNVRKRHTTYTGAGGRMFPSWTWTITRLADFHRFRDLVGILGKDDAVERVLNARAEQNGRPSRWMHDGAPDGYRWERIRTIESIGEQPTVAICVPGPAAYVTSFVEHNSHIASRLAAWWVAVHEPGEAFLVTTAPSWPQVRAILWRYIRQAHAANNLPGYVTQNAEWKINGELVGYGRKPANTDASGFQGIHADRVLTVIDEGSGVPAQLFVAAEALATNDASRTLVIGNPDDASSHFAAVCQREPGWNRIKISAYDSPNLSGEKVPDVLARRLVSRWWVEDKRERWHETNPLYIAKVLGEFADAEEGLIPLSWVRAAHVRWHAWQEKRLASPVHIEPPGRRVFGVDVAWQGEDRTAIVVRQGDVVNPDGQTTIDTWAKLDTTQTAGIVAARLRGQVQARAVIDVVGVGAGVYDQLARDGWPVEAFNGARSTKRRDSTGEWKFANVRSASYWQLRQLLDPSAGATLALPEDDDLTADLTTPKWEPRAGGVIMVEPKDDIRRRLGRSPDLADALAMAMWTDTPPRGVDSDVADRRADAPPLEHADAYDPTPDYVYPSGDIAAHGHGDEVWL